MGPRENLHAGGLQEFVGDGGEGGLIGKADGFETPLAVQWTGRWLMMTSEARAVVRPFRHEAPPASNWDRR